MTKEHSVRIPELHKYSIMELEREMKSDSENESQIDEPPANLPDLIKMQPDDIRRMSWRSNNDEIIEPNKMTDSQLM